MTRTVGSPPRPRAQQRTDSPFAYVPSARLSEELAELGFGVWSHDSRYALGLHERIGWGEALRIGLARYNTMAEMDKFQRDTGPARDYLRTARR